jgi:hypothetical protein
MSKIEKSAQVAEIVAAFAVVVSLIYVGLEIRQNTEAIRLANQQSGLALGNEWDSWLQDQTFAGLYIEGGDDFSSLSEVQQLQLDKFIGQGLNLWEFAFYSHRDGLMNDEPWEGWDRFFKREIGAGQAWRLLWGSKRDSYGESFQAHVDAYLAGN